MFNPHYSAHWENLPPSFTYPDMPGFQPQIDGKTFLQLYEQSQNHRVSLGESPNRRTEGHSQVSSHNEQCSCYVDASRPSRSVRMRRLVYHLHAGLHTSVESVKPSPLIRLLAERSIQHQSVNWRSEKVCKPWTNSINRFFLAWWIRYFVSLSDKRPFSLDRIISSISPFNFSITTKILSGVSNILSRLTTPAEIQFMSDTMASYLYHPRPIYNSILPGCDRFCRMATSFLSCASCFVGNLDLSMTLMAAGLVVFRWTPMTFSYLSTGQHLFLTKDQTDAGSDDDDDEHDDPTAAKVNKPQRPCGLTRSN